MALGMKRAVFTLVMDVKSLSSNVIYTHMRPKGQRSDIRGIDPYAFTIQAPGTVQPVRGNLLVRRPSKGLLWRVWWLIVSI